MSAKFNVKAVLECLWAEVVWTSVKVGVDLAEGR